MTGTTRSFDSVDIDILRTAMEIAFSDQTDEEVAAFFDPRRVRQLEETIQNLYAESGDGVAVIT